MLNVYNLQQLWVKRQDAELKPTDWQVFHYIASLEQEFY
jgi:hypothetical protein